VESQVLPARVQFTWFMGSIFVAFLQIATNVATRKIRHVECCLSAREGFIRDSISVIFRLVVGETRG